MQVAAGGRGRNKSREGAGREGQAEVSGELVDKVMVFPCYEVCENGVTSSVRSHLMHI